ncbi:MAG: flagellar basal body P-ring formation protein FlgA [candidate division Zixibacteria bacterium]|nr:flagellar basal body P-ring formation protein FlgA [candidate division Zixibacteria bacterium]
MLWLILLPVVVQAAAGRMDIDVEQAIRENYLDDKHEYVITVPNTTTVPRGGYDYLKVEPLPGAVPQGSYLVKVSFYRGGRLLKSANLAVRVSIFQEVLVAHERIKRGRLLRAELFKTSKRDVTKLRDRPPISVAEFEAMCAARTIARGHVITAAMIAKQKVVKRGDLVRIQYQRGPLSLTAAGEARQAGGQGDLIKAKNLSSGKIIMAEVQDEQEVRVIK